MSEFRILPIYLVDGLEIQPYSANFPTNVWNLNTKGKIQFFPDGQAQVHCIPITYLQVFQKLIYM